MAKILVVDDNETNREYLVTLLGYAGHRMLEASDGNEALLLAQAASPDLVITDIIMPTTDGFDFVKRLRSDPNVAATPVVFYTGTYGEREARLLARGCGIGHILNKPLEPQEILKVVDEVLGHPEAQPLPQGAGEGAAEDLGLITDAFRKSVQERENLAARLAALAQLGSDMIQEHDLPSLVKKFCRSARDIVSCKHGFLALFDEKGETFRECYFDGFDPETTKTLGNDSVPPVVLNAVRETGSLLRLSDLKVGGEGFSLGDSGVAIHSLLGIPIKSKRGVYGWLCLCNKVDEPDFTEDDERLAITLAAKLGTAYENASLYEALRKSQQQLFQAQKMEALGRLAGGVAHDFNNLLTVILGYCELLTEDLEETRRWQALEIRKAAERAAALTRQLLTFSRKQVAEPRVLDLNALISGLDKMLRRVIGEDVDLVTVPAPGLRTVVADPGQMEQAVMNLVVNARDAMPGGGRLTIETSDLELDDTYATTHPGVRPGPYVMLAVTDTGCGMDAETHSHIFEPFFTTKEAGKGTGLGLATVYGIVRQWGGHIGVYSEPGKGTTFKIYLPRSEKAEKEGARPEQEVKSLHGSETVLLVEDEDSLRSLSSRALSRYGYRVLEARNGKEALRMAEQFRGPIHLLITDVVMPEMDGVETARQMTSLRPGMKVLCMSGYPDQAFHHQRRLKAGIAYLQKPFSPQSLASKVRRLLDT